MPHLPNLPSSNFGQVVSTKRLKFDTSFLSFGFTSTGDEEPPDKKIQNACNGGCDVFFEALKKHCKIIESALMSKCNMNNQVRENSRQALGFPKRRNPAIIVKNVPNEVNNEDLKVFSEQNPEIVDDESIRQCKVRFTLKTFQHTRHVVIETHPTDRKSILRQTRLKIIWSVCDVDDFLIINRCFNCLGYNH
ncbi:hypothetical protein TNIN_446151 [Trichonephila inaurata madagascariensis]|uniref:Uncharacterized protein n=1 Tax=Trichonephila inaurata madagascariensis TaxID=2747483 RepID=A0A8X6JU62_9ARAC|nr:hypothetical protein TNIN_446151 [Trichonephila inaurata madagascariensis]